MNMVVVTNIRRHQPDVQGCGLHNTPEDGVGGEAIPSKHLWFDPEKKNIEMSGQRCLDPTNCGGGAHEGPPCPPRAAARNLCPPPLSHPTTRIRACNLKPDFYGPARRYRHPLPVWNTFRTSGISPLNRIPLRRPGDGVSCGAHRMPPHKSPRSSPDKQPLPDHTERRHTPGCRSGMLEPRTIAAGAQSQRRREPASPKSPHSPTSAPKRSPLHNVLHKGNRSVC